MLANIRGRLKNMINLKKNFLIFSLICRLYTKFQLKNLKTEHCYQFKKRKLVF